MANKKKIISNKIDSVIEKIDKVKIKLASLESQKRDLEYQLQELIESECGGHSWEYEGYAGHKKLFVCKWCGKTYYE